MKKIFLCLSFLFFISCATEMAYNPHMLSQDSNPHIIIRNTLLGQPTKYAPRDVEITNDYIRISTDAMVSKRSFWTGGVTSNIVSKFDTVTSNNIGELKLNQKGRYWIVVIYDKSGAVRYKTYTSTQSIAQEFMDALYTWSKDMK